MVVEVRPPGKVLLIYPRKADAQGLEDYLSSAGIPFHTVDNVFEGISSFVATPTDAVILGLSGLDERDVEVVRFFRKTEPGVYLLVTFSAGERELAVNAVVNGADGYLLEPFYRSEFLGLVRRGLDRARAAGVGGEEELVRLGVRAEMARELAERIGRALRGEQDDRERTDELTRIAEELSDHGRAAHEGGGPLDVNTLLEEDLSLDPEVTLELRLAEDLPDVVGDPAALGSAFRSLAGVAVEGGWLEVSTEADYSVRRVVVRFRTSEFGAGRDALDRFWEPFKSPLASASGLAAATVRAVVESMGGIVRAEGSETVGLTVTVELPIAEREGEEGE